MPKNLNHQSDENKLALLIDAVISGEINPSQFEELSSKLQLDSAARQRYISEMQLESALRGLNSTPESTQVFPPVRLESPNGTPNWFQVGLFASAILVAVLGVLAYQSWDSERDDPLALTPAEVHAKDPELAKLEETQPPTANGFLTRSVARITNGQDLAWKTASEISVGSWLKPDSYELTAGNLEITFDSGAVVYVAAGSVFDIINSNEVRLQRGSLEADVPEQAIGFRVQTPSGEITDLSTKFGVEVSEKGESDVHVLQGLVEAKPSGSEQTQLLTLKENSAIRMFLDSPPEPVEFSPSQFFEFGSRNNKSKLSFLHFSFDENEVSQGALKNSGAGGQGRGGKIVDGRAANSWVQVDGPFGKSLFFSGEGAKIETPIRGIDGNRPRTLMFWVRINPETPIKSAYSFASWGRSSDGRSRDGHKWQIGWNPNYELANEGVMGAVRTEFGGGYVIGSTDLRDGRWHHIASVFLGGGQGDNVANLVRHYVDGKLESVSGSKDKRIMTHSDQRTLAIGEYIGAGEDMFTGYKGWIDEFYVFDKALTPSQIVRIMEHNQTPAAEEIVAE